MATVFGSAKPPRGLKRGIAGGPDQVGCSILPMEYRFLCSQAKKRPSMTKRVDKAAYILA